MMPTSPRRLSRASRALHRQGTAVLRLLAALLVVFAALPTPAVDAQSGFLGKAEISLYGIGLTVQPATQTVPKGYATIVSTFLQAAAPPQNLPPFPAGTQVLGTLRGPSFQQPIDLVAAPNTPFNIPVLTVAGTHTVDNIRLVDPTGTVLLYGTPEAVVIEVIDKLLVTTITSRALTADEIAQKGIVYDKTNFQAYNFTAAFAIDDGSTVDVSFPVVLPTLGTFNLTDQLASIAAIDAPQLHSLQTLIPDTLQIQARIPNLKVVGFSLTLDQQAASQDFFAPKIPGVIVIPGDIGFLNQFFSVMLMVGNVAPTGSNLVVSNLTASLVLPAGQDSVVGSTDDPLAMAKRANGVYPMVVGVTQAGPDGLLGTGDDITDLGPGQTGNAEFLVEGRREGTHVVEMELSGTLNGMPTGPVPVRGRVAGAVLVRNPKFQLTFTHPDTVNAGDPYTLDVTVTNTSTAPANFVSINLFPANLSGAQLTGSPTQSITSIDPGDSATVSFDLVSLRSGAVTAATLDSDENVAGRFVLKSAIGELGVPLSPDSLVLPKEANSLPPTLKSAALGLLGRAWSVATAPPAAMPVGLSRFSRQMVLDRAVEVAEAGMRISLGESVERSSAALLFDFLGSGYADLSGKVPANDTTGMLARLQADVAGFDTVRRLSQRGDVFASAAAEQFSASIATGSVAFHQTLAAQLTASSPHVSILIAAPGGLPVDAVLVDDAGQRTGDVVGVKTQKQIPFSDSFVVNDASGQPIGQMLVVAAPQSTSYRVELTRRAGALPSAPVDVSVAYPASNGGLNFVSWAGVQSTELPVLDQASGESPQILFRLMGNAAPTGRVVAPARVADPPPTVLGAFQIAGADVAGCPLDGRVYEIGRVVAVLFSEEVTAASVQDRLPEGLITAFTSPGNRIASVALQPGGRVAYVALREPVGPFVPSSIVVDGVTDRSGAVLAGPVTLPIVTTVGPDAGIVSGRVQNADGTAAGGVLVRMFYEFNCGGDQTTVGVAEDVADPAGAYRFDYVLHAPAMTVRIQVVDPSTNDLRNVRFALARSGQHLNVDVVMLGRGTLTGRTLAEDGQVLANTALRVTSLTDQSQYAATSDASGAFVVSRIPVGNVLIEAVNVARPAQLFVSDLIPFAGATIARDLVLLDPVAIGPTAPKTGTLTGLVVKADGVTPAPNLTVVAYYATRSQAGVACSPPPGGTKEPVECAIQVVQTDATGHFAFSTLTAGQLRINTFDQVELLDASVRVTLDPQEVRDITVLLSGGFGTVNGVVLDSSGNPVPDAVVGGGFSLVNVNADGTFTLSDVPVGRRRIVAASNVLQATGESTIDLVQQGEVVNTTIRMPAVGAVAGIVRDHGGVPQARIKVYVLQDCFDEFEQPSVCIIGQAMTDANGAYRIGQLGIGKYRVSAFTADLRDGNIHDIAIRYDRQTLVTDITFRGGTGKVNGRVLRAAGTCSTPPCLDTPLPARVSISGDQLVTAGGNVGVRFEYVQNFEVVDNDFTTGEYAFSQKVWTGPFTVRAAGQFSPDPVAAEGTMPGPNQTVTIDLRLQPTSRLTGTIYESDGFTPVTNRQIALTFKSDAVVVICHDDPDTGESICTTIPQGIQQAFAATDANGQFAFPIVNAGPFTLTATDAQTGKVASVKGSVRAGETVDVPMRLLGRAPVTVRVFRSNGTTPVQGARVSLQGLEYPMETRSGVAVNGTIDFAGADALSEGQFVVTALDANGFAGRKAGRVVVDGTAATVDVFLFDATGTVAGQVVKADSAGALVPTPNAEVIISLPGGEPLAYAITDATGNFTVALIPTGTVRIDAFDPVSAGRGRGQAVVLGGTQSAFQTIALEALGSIRGTVVQSGSLAPLKGWTVQLAQSTSSGRALPTQVTQTGVDGSFSFPGAAVGNFSLFASQRSVVGNASASGALTRGGQLLDVPMVVDIVRRVTGSVSGVVLGAQATPVPNAQVSVCPQGEACRSTLADGAGRFLVTDIALGRFTVRGSAQVTGAPSVGTSGGTLLFEGDVADVTIALLGLSSLEGTVYETVNGVQVPAANATVRLTGQPGSGCAGACVQGTDPAGQFRFINVPAQTFTVSATSFNGQQGSIGDVLVPGQAKTNLQIVLAPSVSLSGRVLLASTLPAAGVIVDLTANGGHLFTETAADGTFTFDAVSSQSYSLFVQDPIGSGLARRSGPVTLSAPMALGDIILDEAAPVVASSAPAAGAIGVTRNTDILVTFSEPLDATTVSAQSVTLLGPAGPVAGLVDTQGGDTIVRFRLLPGVQLADQARYTLRISGVADRVGRRMSADAVIGFTTLDVTAPSIANLVPVQSATGVAIDTVVRVQFSEIIDPSKFTGAPIVVTGPAGVVAGRIDYLQSNSIVVFTPNVPLLDTTRYSVRVSRATDLVGLTGAADTTYVFDTTDRTPPAILSLTLDTGATAVEGTVARARAVVAETDIAVVDFFLNGAFAFAARSTPFAMDFTVLPSLADAAGHVTVTALATDTSGNRGIVPAQVVLTVVPDQPPVTTIVQPSTLTPAPGERVTLSVQATDDVGVTEISYAARTAVVLDASARSVAPASKSRSESFAFNVPAGALPGSTLTLEASSKDTASHTTAAAPVVLRVRDTLGPVVEITGLSSGQRVAPGATITAVVVASDVSGITNLGFAVSGITASTQTRPVNPAQVSVATSFSFTVPANATSTDRVFVDAYAIDAAGNRGDASRLIVPVADRQAPTLTLRTASGANTMIPGGTVDVIAESQDDLAIASVSLAVSGAFSFSDTRTPAVQSASDTQTFTLSIPSTLVNGDTVTVTARATDASGNQSVPVSIALTAQTVTSVTLTPSVLLLAGDQADISVTLGAPAPVGGVRVDLLSQAPGVATVISGLTFAQGETTKLATVHAVAGGTTTIDALVNGVARATTTVTVSGGVVRGDVLVPAQSGFQPVPGAQVTVFHAGTPLTTVADAQGHFLIEGVNGQSFTMTATDGTRLDVESFQLDVPNGSASVSLILLDMGLIQGTVYRPDLATPVGAATQVDLFEAAAPNVAIATTFTDANGNYQFPLVAPGPYIVEASDATGNRGRSSVQLASGQQLTAPVVFLGRGSVTVKVRTGVGAAVAGAVVQFHASSIFGSAAVRTGNTDATGQVTFPNVFVGTVSATGTDPFTSQGGSASGQVTADGEAVTLNVQFAQYGNLTGTIFRRDGVTPAPGAQVTVDLNPGGRFSTTADATGVYRLDFLPFGAFTITVFDPATRGRATDSGVFAASGQTVVRNEVLLPQGALLITVVDANGTPVNGASVTATTQAQGLVDSRSAATDVLNGNGGQVLLDRLLAGTFNVTATAAGLGGAATGVLVADEIHAVTVQLEAQATISGTVFEPDGQTPAVGSVRVLRQSGGQTTVTLVNGVFSVPNLKLGTYTVEADDASSRFRARSGVLTLTTNGQDLPVSLTFVGLGTVQGRVLHPSGGDAGNLTVTLRSFNPTFGGFMSAQTDAAGNFAFSGVPIGSVNLTTSKASEQLIGETNGAVTAHGQIVPLDILLEANAVGLPTALNDIQDTSYGISTDGGLYGGTGSVFIRGGSKLTLTVNGTTLPFTGASFGTREDGGREIVVRQSSLLGLNVIRKVAVPVDGYFARFLEVLQNPGATPITVDVNLTSQPYGQTTAFCCVFGENQYFVGSTSSGDAVVDATTATTADQWASLVVSGQDSYYNGNSGTPLGFVFSGPGATAPVNTASFGYVQSVPTLKYGWNSITVPAGGEVVLMHFVAEQASNSAATASAQRLVQLPPEALNGLSAAELAGIANFVLPSNGVSLVAPLPAVDGGISGRVLEGDNSTPVPNAAVTFRSTDPVLARIRRATADALGNFSFTGGLGHPVPVTGYSLTAQHTVNQFTTSPTAAGAFPGTQNTTTQDVVFSNSGILRGVVQRHTGLPASGAQVVVGGSFASQTVGSNGQYAFGGVFTGNVTLSGSLQHAQGTALSIVPQTVTLVAGQVRNDILLVEPTGSVTGTVVDANSNVQVSRPVTLSRSGFSRFTTTDSAGRFTFPDLPEGTFTVTSTDPNSGFPTTQQATVVRDQVQTLTLQYAGKGSITVTVTRSTGVPVAGITVSVASLNVNTQTLTTDANGVAGPFNNLPLGQTFNITASHPGSSSAIRTLTSLVLASTQVSTTMALPAFGTVSATITRPNGTLPGANFNAFLSSTSGSPSFSASANTNAASQVAFGVVPVGRPFTIRAFRPPTVQFGQTYGLTSAPFTLAADGEAMAITTHVPAVAQVVVAVTNGGQPVANSRIEQRDSNNGFFQFRANTNAAGTVTIAEVPEGVVDIRAYQPGSSSNVLDLVQGQVTAADDAATVTIPVNVKSYTVTVTGRIFENDGGTGLPSVSLRLLRAVDGTVLSSTCTCFSNPADGTFTFPAVTSPTVGLVLEVFSPIGGASTKVPLPIAASGTVTQDVTLPVYTATLQGHVYASDGVTPVPAGVVFEYSLTGNQGGWGASVQPDGSYLFSPLVLPIEGVRLEFNLTGLTGGKFSVNTLPFTSSHQVVTTDIVLNEGTVSTIVGTVVAGDGITPLTGVTVDLEYGGGIVVAGTGTSTTTDAQGRFRFVSAVPAPGTFTLTAHSPRNFSNTVQVNGAATVQGATVDVGAMTLPVSIVSGFATTGATTPVLSLSAFVTNSTGNVTFADVVDQNTFTFYELPADSYTLTVSDQDAGTSASAPVTLATSSSVVTGVHVQLPVVGAVQVQVVDENGNPTDAATVSLLGSNTFERIIYPFNNTGGGQYDFNGVALGDYLVQGALDVCDQSGNCSTRYTSATASVTSTGTVQVALSFADTPQVSLLVEDSNGSPLADTDVNVAVQSLTSGTLGTFNGSLQVTTDAQGLVQLPYVPVGSFVVSVSNPATSEAGTGGGVASASQPTTVEVRLSYDAIAIAPFTAWQLNSSQQTDRFTVFDGESIIESYRWNGSNAYENRAFRSALDLSFGGTPVAASYSDNSNELTFSPVVSDQVPGIIETRRMRSLEAGNLIRMLDTFTNTTSTTRSFQVSLATTPNISSQFGPEVAPSATTGGYFVRYDSGGLAPAFGIVYAGADAPVAPLLVTDDGFSTFAALTTLTVPAGQSVSLLNYLLVDSPLTQGTVAARADALTTATTPTMLEGLSREDLLTIANFTLTIPPPGPGVVRVKVLDLDGNQTSGASVALVGNGTTTILQPYQDVNGLFEFTNVVPGAYAVQASFDGCDAVTCGVFYTDTTVTVGSDSTVTKTVSFAQLGQTVIEVRDENGQPMPSEDVDIEVRSLAGAGPLGTYSMQFTATLGPASAVLIDHLPPGAFSVHVHAIARGMDGLAQGTATKFQPSTTVVQLAFEVMDFRSSSQGLLGSDGFLYVVGSTNAVEQAYYWDGTQTLNAGALTSAGRAFSGVTPICCAPAAVDGQNGWQFAPVAVDAAPGVTMTRHLRGTTTGQYLRFFDVFTNTSTVPQAVPVSLHSTPNLSLQADMDVAPSAVTAGYSVRSDPAQGALVFGTVYNGPNAAVQLTPAVGSDQVTLQPGTVLQLAPGQSVALLHFVLLRLPGDVAGAATGAQELGALTAAEALDGLSQADLGLIVNFNLVP